MAPQRVAIVGTGIAGLACAYFLRHRYRLTLYEQTGYLGGHTCTIDVQHQGESVTFDTGFMVYNRVTYPNLCRFLADLKVPAQPTTMSFSVQHVPSGLEYSGSGWNGLFAQRRNLVRVRHWRMLRQIDRFNREAAQTLSNEAAAEMTLDDYVRERGYGEDFLNHYLVPMSGAVWSTPPELMLRFPAGTLLRFFHNHGFLGLNTQHPWWTISGGAREYVRRLVPLLDADIRLDCPVRQVRREADGVTVALASGKAEKFDRVILACHGDQALRLIEAPDNLERHLLGEFRYQPNLATVHTDPSVMPRCRRAWASWNYRITDTAKGRGEPQTIYWMNSLQGVSPHQNYFVSINAGESVDRAQVLREIAYDHPLFTLGAVRAQRELPRLNQRGHQTGLFFAGSYFRNGFHEDAFTSALDCCRTLVGGDVWPTTAENQN